MNNNQKPPTYSNYNPFPFRRAGPKATEYYELGVNRASIPHKVLQRQFNWASQTLMPIKNFDWEDISALHFSENEERGLLFLESEEGSIVLNGHSRPATFYFINTICQILNISVPDVQVVQFDDPKFKHIIKSIERCTFTDEIIYNKILFVLNRPFLILEEYIPGVTLNHVTQSRAQIIFSHLAPQSRHRLIQVGLVMAFDIFLQNSQRYPLPIFDNEGKQSNMKIRVEPAYTMLTKDLLNGDVTDFGLFYAFDHQTINKDRITNSLYYSKVEEYLNMLFLDIQAVMESQLDPMYEVIEEKLVIMNSLKSLIRRYSLYEVKEMALLQIALGIVIGLNNIVELGSQNIQQVANKLRILNDCNNQWNNELDQLNLQFYDDMILIFRKFLKIYARVFDWVKDITLTEYNINKDLLNKIIGEQQQLQEQPKDLSVSQSMDQKDINNPLNNSQTDKIDGAELNKKIKDLFGVDLEATNLTAQQVQPQKTDQPKSENKVKDFQTQKSQKSQKSEPKQEEKPEKQNNSNTTQPKGGILGRFKKNKAE